MENQASPTEDGGCFKGYRNSWKQLNLFCVNILAFIELLIFTQKRKEKKFIHRMRINFIAASQWLMTVDSTGTWKGENDSPFEKGKPKEDCQNRWARISFSAEEANSTELQQGPLHVTWSLQTFGFKMLQFSNMSVFAYKRKKNNFSAHNSQLQLLGRHGEN